MKPWLTATANNQSSQSLHGPARHGDGRRRGAMSAGGGSDRIHGELPGESSGVKGALEV